MRGSVIARITELARRDKNVFLITGDAGFGVLDDYRTSFPDRYLNLGVAEQNMIGVAAGLGLAGYKVFVYNIVPFVLYRCYEQVRNDVCYQELPITLIGIGSGVTYSPQGVTHYSVEDIALARTLPNLVILSPSDPIEARGCVEYAFKSKNPVYIRLAKSGEPVIHKGRRGRNVSRPIVLGEGKGVAVLFHGSVSTEVIAAVEGLDKKPMVVSVPMIQPLEVGFLKRKLSGVHTIISVEEHFADGGLGSVLAEWICKEGLDFRLIKLGIKNEFIHQIKNNAGMRSHYGISAGQIKKAILAAGRE